MAYINISSIRDNVSQSWISTRDVGGVHGVQNYYVAAPVWQVIFGLKGSGWWGYQEGSLTISYWNGSSWSTTFSQSWDGSGSGNSIEWTLKHNYEGGSSSDVHDKHLWRITTYYGNNSGSSWGTIYAGPMSMISDSQYTSYFQYKLMKSSAIFISTDSQDYSDGNAFDSAKGSGYLRGNLITTSRAKYLCAYG